MAKAIIPKIQLPGVSEESTNKIRYRIINRNRNLYSQWSVIGEIKREREETSFDDNPTSFSTDNSISNLINIAWYTSDINQEFDVYVSYLYKQFNNTLGNYIYSRQPLQFLGRKNVNSVSISPQPPFPGRVFTNPFANYSIQAMVKLPEYPRIFSVPINILDFDRNANLYNYYLDRNPTFEVDDYVNIYLENGPSVVDNSEFTGIKRVASIGPKSFSVTSVGANIPNRSAYSFDGSINTVEKVNGSVQFITDDILFT